MPGQARQKQERVIEAVRQGLEGDTAVEFVHKSGYAISSAGIARYLRQMGGRGFVETCIAEGKTNGEILALCFPDEDLSDFAVPTPTQGELFAHDEAAQPATLFGGLEHPLYETTKLTLRVPADLYEAIRIAARAENKSQNQLIVEILTHALSRLPGPLDD